MDADVIVVGAGLAGLVATHELTSRAKKVAVVDQENAANLGGQAFWSFGGLFLVNSAQQRRLGVTDSVELAWSDWRGSAQFDRLADEDSWAVRWARAYVEFAAGEKQSWLAGHGIRFLPVVGWAERGDLSATGHGNSVPRFHVAWAPAPASSPRSSPPRTVPPRLGWSPSTTAIALTDCSSPTARSPVCAAPSWPPTTRPAALRRTANRSVASS
jgi:predicted oxidoreductase